jgi:glycosyltransferase involved in cell wall biosynthesis
VFNAAPFLGEAVESVLNQTLEDLEFLIYDDGSTDGSREMLADFARRDSRIRYFPREHAGYVTWLNAGIEAARAPLIARMDADDISLPTRLAEQHAFLLQNPACVAVGTDCLSIDVDGEPLCSSRKETDPARLLELLLDGTFGVILHPTAMFRRVAALEAGGYRKQFETTEDLDLWCRLSHLGQLANLPRVLLHYRHHAGSVCYSRMEKQRANVDMIVNSARVERGLKPLPDSLWRETELSTSAMHRRWSRWAIGAGNPHPARKHARRAVDLNPLDIRAWLLLLVSYMPLDVTAQAIQAWRFTRGALGSGPGT